MVILYSKLEHKGTKTRNCIIQHIDQNLYIKPHIKIVILLKLRSLITTRSRMQICLLELLRRDGFDEFTENGVYHAIHVRKLPFSHALVHVHSMCVENIFGAVVA